MSLATLAGPTTLSGPAQRAVTRSRPMMGGSVLVHLRDASPEAALDVSATRVLDRLAAWAARLTRFDPTSELSRLNADPRAAVPIGPTLTAALDWARTAEGLTDGLVDIAMLDARLAAEAGTRVAPPLPASRRWSLRRHGRAAVVLRQPGVRLDLDGVAKGWLADRALDLVSAPTAMIDGDGDIAARIAWGDELLVDVADPRHRAASLGLIRLAGGFRNEVRVGVATSGISVHRWGSSGDSRHHLIDPATWRPAVTDLLQVTVVARTAGEAEAFAKAAVIAGTDRMAAMLDRPGVHGALLLTADGQIRATPGMLRWLA